MLMSNFCFSSTFYVARRNIQYFSTSANSS